MSTPFPKFLDELLANPPTAGTGVHNWLFKVSRQLHAHMGMVEMENFCRKKLKAAGAMFRSAKFATRSSTQLLAPGHQAEKRSKVILDHTIARRIRNRRWR